MNQNNRKDPVLVGMAIAGLVELAQLAVAIAAWWWIFNGMGH